MNQYAGLNENKRFARGSENVSRQRRRFRDMFAVLGFAFLLVGASLWIASKYSDLRQVGYEMVDLRNEARELRAERDKLRSELASLSRPERILPKILAQGLRPLTEGQVIKVRILPETKPPVSEGVEMVALFNEIQHKP